MRIALIDSTSRAQVYPIALLKIGAWLKSRGDSCELFMDRIPENGNFDETWITTIFTYNIPHALRLAKVAQERMKKVLVGGIAATLLPEYFRRNEVEVYQGLLPEAEKMAPDYSLLRNPPSYSITHASRGCIRKCRFCMVSTLEPEFKNRDNWEKDLYPRAKQVLFYDNNWLAKSFKELKKDVEKMRSLIAARKIGEIDSIDFNQGLDCRLLTEEKADLLKDLPLYPIRFAFDNISEDGYLQKAIKILKNREFTSFSYYALYNFKDTVEDFYYRIKESVIMREKWRIECTVFPMRYQPILDININRDYIGPHWTLKKLKGFKNLINSHSVHGQISTKGCSIFSPIEEFEYFFGKNTDEFNRLISYPKIRRLAKRRKEKLRLMRFKKRIENLKNIPEKEIRATRQ